MQTTLIRPTDRIATRRARLGLGIHLAFVTVPSNTSLQVGSFAVTPFTGVSSGISGSRA